jgi:hypothetical protein
VPTFWSSGFTDAGGWNSTPSYWATIQFPDVNGDGRADVCARGAGGVGCAISNGLDGFGPVATWSTDYADAGSWASSQSYWGTIQFPDVTGDGKADICARSSGGIFCGVSNGTSGFSAPTVWHTNYSDDVGWANSPSNWATIQFPDLNGDGRADVCGRSGDGILCATSNGTNGFGPANTWGPPFNNTNGWNLSQSYWGTIQFPDVNGDGKPDVCGRNAGGVVCSISDGATGFNGSNLWTDEFSDANGFNADPTLWGTIQFPDLNGDGKSDICARTASGLRCGLSDGTRFVMADWLAEFTDANGWKTDPSYGATLQTPNLNVTGCKKVTTKSTFSQPLSRRLPPF